MRYLFIFVLAIGITSFLAVDCAKSDSQNDTKPAKMKITIGTSVFEATLYDNETAKAFKPLLPLTINMIELNGNEKYHYLQSSLPTKADATGKIQAGDLMLYGGNCLVLFYKTFNTTYTYTRIGRISDATGLSVAAGNANVTVTIDLK